MTRPTWKAVRTKDSCTRKLEITSLIPSHFETNLNSNSGKMVLWDASAPSSWSADFLSNIAIPCPNSLSLDLLICHMASIMSLDSVTIEVNDLDFLY